MTVEERLEALEKEIQQLKDVQAIKELKSRYFCALDTKNWEELEKTMTEDIETSYSNGKLVFHGPKEITAYFDKSMPKTEITLHQGHNPQIWFESDTVAYGKWYLQDSLIFDKGDPYEGLQVNGSAIYTDKYVKVDGQWLIQDTGYIRIYEEQFMRDKTHNVRKNMFAPKKKKVLKKKSTTAKSAAKPAEEKKEQ